MNTTSTPNSILVQILALFAATFAVAFAISEPYTRLFVVSANTAPVQPATSDQPVVFLLSFAVVTAVALILVKKLKHHSFWKVFFGLGAYAGLFTTTYYTVFFIVESQTALIIALIVPALLLAATLKSSRSIWQHNLLIVFAVAGVARLFGVQFTPRSTALILVVLAVYDIFAVYFSKLMVEMAKTLFSRHAFLGFIVPRQLRDWSKPTSDLRLGEEAIAIGAGDVALPLFFALSHLFYTGTYAFWIISVCVVFGVALLYVAHSTIAQKRPMPGLPPLVLSVFIGHWLISIV